MNTGLLILGVAICVMGILGFIFARPKRFRKDYTQQLEKLISSIKPGQYQSGNTLQQGAVLHVEQLDLSGIGLYTDEQKATIIAEGQVDDFFLTNLFHCIGWARKSDEGVKWHTYFDSEIKLHKKG